MWSEGVTGILKTKMVSFDMCYTYTVWLINLLFPGGEGGLGKIIILSDVENESYVSVDRHKSGD